jgi:hypothetical protein
MRGLRILLTNHALADRAGSELYVRDVATGLLALGHRPVAYSPRLGEVADELRRATVPVVQDLDALGEPPDLIHGQHHWETMTALLRFPGVPCVFFCHGWVPWEELPPRHPRVLRYVAVDWTCRDRLVLESGISPEQALVLLNFVNLDCFRPRGPLPERPQRALVFSNAASEDSYLPAVRAACGKHGLSLDVAGLDSGRPCARPEELLPGYDLVFAKGRCALEALAVGAAVIVCDRAGLGPLVTAVDFDRLRALNFGIRTLNRPVTAEAVERRIACYDAADAGRVSARVRGEASRDDAVRTIAALYEEVLSGWRREPAADPLAEARAAASYLRSMTPALQWQRELPIRRAHDERGRDLEALKLALAAAEWERDEARALRWQHERERAELTGACRKWQDECARTREMLQTLHRSLPLRLRSWVLRLPLLGRAAGWVIRRLMRKRNGESPAAGRAPAGV